MKKTDYVYEAIIDRWIDGDTVDVWVDLGFRVGTKQRLRLAEIDTPEVRGEERDAGRAATDFARSLAPEGSQVTIRSSKTGKYGRWIADIWPPGSDADPGGEEAELQTISSLLAEAGFRKSDISGAPTAEAQSDPE